MQISKIEIKKEKATNGFPFKHWRSTVTFDNGKKCATSQPFTGNGMDVAAVDDLEIVFEYSLKHARKIIEEQTRL